MPTDESDEDRSAMPDRLPPPGPSFLREQALEAPGGTLKIGMSQPTTTDDSAMPKARRMASSLWRRLPWVTTTPLGSEVERI